MGRIKRYRKRVLNPHKILSKEDIRALIRYADVRDKPLIWFLYSSGARINSVLGLNYGRINWKTTAPWPVRFREDETKFNVAYTTFICEEAFEALKNYMRWRRRRGERLSADSPLFASRYGGRITYNGSLKSIKRVIERSGIHVDGSERLGHHSLRAAFQHQLQASVVNQYIIESLMGHSLENTTTGRYSIGLTVDYLLDAYMKADWSLETDKGKVLDLDREVSETKQALGNEALTRQKLEALYTKRLDEQEKKLEIQDKTIEGMSEQILQFMEIINKLMKEREK